MLKRNDKIKLTVPDVFVSAPPFGGRKKLTKSPPVRPKSRPRLKIVPLADQKPTLNPLAAFVAKPQKIRFATQEEKEEIVLLLRRHPITNLSWAFKTSLMILLPQVVAAVIPFDFLPARYQFFTLIIWYLLTFAYAFERFLSWLFNVNIITDERIIDIDFPTILYRDISETKIEKIQDISTKTGGYWRSIFNFGDVWIQTSGTEREICFEAVPQPQRVSQVLNDLMYQEEIEKIEGRIR